MCVRVNITSIRKKKKFATVNFEFGAQIDGPQYKSEFRTENSGNKRWWFPVIGVNVSGLLTLYTAITYFHVSTVRQSEIFVSH